MSPKRKRSPEAASATENSEEASIFRSEPVEDRSSIFIGHYSPSLSGKELQRLDEVKDASHRMLAWRKPSRQRSLTGVLMDVGHDDDGEQYGGKRVEKVLERMDVSGSCLVARWYGGILLGPVRFTHIETCAREAIKKWQDSKAEQNKRLKQEDAEAQARLVKSLTDRDRSIEMLREMAAEKENRVRNALVTGMEALDGDSTTQPVPETANTLAPQPTQDKKPAVDYPAMSLERLKALEKARDATLAFLLKRIDKAEADIAALGEPEKPP